MDAFVNGKWIKSEMVAGNESIHLSFDAVQFYDANSAPITLNKFVSDDCAYFENEEWKLEFNEEVSRWQLNKQNGKNYIFDSFGDILPLQSHKDRMQKLAHNQIENISVNQVTVQFDAEWNGIYKLYQPKLSGIEMDILCRDLLAAQWSIYFREATNGSETIYFLLSHRMSDGVIHKWTMKKVIVIKWNASILRMQSNQFEDASSGLIESIVVEYVLNDILWFAISKNEDVDKSVLRRYECFNSVFFKFDSLFLRMKHKMQQFEFIPIKMSSIKTQNLQCAVDGYLSMNDVIIRSDMFGGNTNAKIIHFRFENLNVCKQFVDLIERNKQIASALYSKMAFNQIIDKICKKVKIQRETNGIGQIIMNEASPLLQSAENKWFIRKLGKYAAKMAPHQLCEWMSSGIWFVF